MIDVETIKNIGAPSFPAAPVGQKGPPARDAVCAHGAKVGIEVSGYRCRTPRGRRGRHVRKECAAKARNHSRVASARPHSEGIAYKPPCGEIAMCLRVGRMGPSK
jgi:hypothetical protein